MVSLPITGLFAAMFALLLIVLSFVVSFGRMKTGVNLGDGDNPMLLGRIRAQGNFVEFVPIGLILLALCEASGAGAALLWSIGLLMLVGRLSHAAGMIGVHNPLRAIGMILTYLSLIAGSAALLIGYFA